MDYQSSQQDFFAWEVTSRDTIDFKTVYVDMADDLMAGLLLSQLVYWHLPKKDGTSRMRISKEGNLWVAKARTEWWAETRLKPRQVDRAAKILVKKGLVFTKRWRFNGSPTTHWRINWNAFLPSLKRESERWKKNCNSPKRKLQQTKALLTNDETVTSLTEIVAETVSQIDQSVSNSPLGESSEPNSTPEPLPKPQQVTDPATPGDLSYADPLPLDVIDLKDLHTVQPDPILPFGSPPQGISQPITDPATPGDQPDGDDFNILDELEALSVIGGLPDTLTEAQPLPVSTSAPSDGLSEPHEYMPDHVSPPGETLLEKIEELGMSQGELVRRMDWREETISAVIQGKMRITSEVALQLEQVLGIPAAFWNSREQQYRQHLAQVVGVPASGSLHDLKVHDRALSPAEVAEAHSSEPPAPKRDYLTDLFAYANRDRPGDSDTHVRPKHWETVSDGEFAVCERVAFLWCGGRLPFPGSIEAHCGAAGWLLHELSGGNLGACIRALDRYHLYYEEQQMSFTIAGPKSLVSVLPAFLVQEGSGGEPGVIKVGG